ncbi:MAG TPA: cupin domain-containing protein [Bryobacteraceae bacterium]|jgi:quercetin dioxygenase-like cupin family protein
MTTYNWNEIPVEQMNAATTRQVIHAQNLTIARIGIAKGGIVPTHAHVNEQVLNMVSGRLKVILDGKEIVLDGGSTLVIPPNVPHSVEALEAVVAVDVFSPRREDWLRGDDAYLRQK